MTKRERAYAKKMQGILDAVGKYDAGKIARIRGILETARTEVAAQVAATEWQAYRIGELKQAVSQAMTQAQALMIAEVQEAQGVMAMAGLDMVDGSLAAAGITCGAPQIALETLEILQGYSADLITGLGQDAIKKINAEIVRTVMGGQGQFEAMQAIGKNLDDKSVFSSIATRAETIYRTEAGTVFSNSRQARMDAVVNAGTEPHVEWHKQWLHSGKAHPRDRHLALDQVIVPYDEDFPGGLPYPHAPGLPASETINCGCSHILTHPDWTDMPTQFTPAPYQEQAAIYD